MDSIEAAPAAEPGEFEREMMKVIQIMKIAGDDLPVTTIKSLVTDLVKKAKEESRDKEEQKEKFQKVGNLVKLFKEANAQRAQEALEDRKPTSNPVRDEIEEAVTKLLDHSDDERDFSKVLFEKARKKPVHVPDFDDILEAPRQNKPRLHIPNESRNLSHILIDKAKLRPAHVKDFESGLDAPRPAIAESSRRPQDFLIDKAKSRPDVTKNFDSGLDAPVFVDSRPKDFSHVLLNKAKNRPNNLKNFDSGLDAPSSEEDFAAEEFSSEPDYEEEYQTEPTTEPINLTEILKLPQTKEMVEDHIMDMIIENPEKAAADLAELFDISTKEEKERTEEELHQMIEQDPLAVTSAFTDLIIAQKENATSPPPLFEPHRIEDPPDAVQGQMLRMTKRPEQPIEDVKMNSQLLNTMMRFIEEGKLSHEEVIEQMINSGLLPVEVTEVGKIPIIVGGRQKPIVTVSHPDVPERSQPLRIQPTFTEQKPREEVNLARLQQLRARQHQMVHRDEHDILKEVSLDDPDKEFEMVKVQDNRQPKEITGSKSPEEKDIEILSSMMDLYEQGLITDTELEQMVIMMEQEGVLDVDLEELGIEKKNNGHGRYNTNKGEGPMPGDVREFGLKHGVVPFTMAIAQRAREELSNPFKNGLPEDIPESPSPTAGYSFFSMGTPRPAFAASTARPPPQLPPPSPGSVHNTHFFEELGMTNPFDSQFELAYSKTSLDFKPSGPSHPEGSVRPGPAPPYYMSARLPPPEDFRPKPISDMTSNMGEDFGELNKGPKDQAEPFRRRPTEPIIRDEPFRVSPPPSFEVSTELPFDHPEYNLEAEMFDHPLRTVPREPFPPPAELKRHVGSQPLPLILHAHEGTGYSHPHFDIPSELINPDAFYRSPRKISSSNLPSFDSHEFHQGFHTRLPFVDHQGFAQRRGKVYSDPEPGSYSIAGTTGYREVDRRIDQIRQSFLKGDGMGSATNGQFS